ncbi:hypothetical protein [Sphingobium sp.]|uniref:hypothetical protein n=1 Tax=Sphingobium sp. TaxID=1912891 RepID=UPI002C8EE317|nr:hypothetical protein [Sphingobium sp.]HUD93487.1 hypothetical protein [Sphingobium sp.]
MPTRRVMMRHVREILRLSLDGRLSTRGVAEHVRTGATTVRDTLKPLDSGDMQARRAG